MGRTTRFSFGLRIAQRLSVAPPSGQVLRASRSLTPARRTRIFDLPRAPYVMLIGILIVVVVLVLVFISLYNRLVSLIVRSQNAWSDIDVQLKRRADLVPNLVETVKGYASHERGTLDAVTQARTRAVAAQSAGPAERAKAEGELTTALRGLTVAVEAYPQLQASGG